MKGLLDYEDIFWRDRNYPEPIWLFDRENRVFLACKENDPNYIPVPFVYRADLIKAFLREYPEYDICPELHQMTDESRLYHDFMLNAHEFALEWWDYYDQKMKEFIEQWREQHGLADIPLEVPKGQNYLTGKELAEELERKAREGNPRINEYLNMKKDDNIMYIEML